MQNIRIITTIILITFAPCVRRRLFTGGSSSYTSTTQAGDVERPTSIPPR